MRGNRLCIALLCILSIISCPSIGHSKDNLRAVRVGTLPILDVLPIHVALENGYFEKEGIRVDIIPCASAAERDQLVVAGSLDVIVNDLVSIALFNKERTNVLGIRYAMSPTGRFFQFAIVAPKSASLKSSHDLKGVPIGVSHATIIHYITERLLMKEGLRQEEIKTVPIPRIPDRLSALMRGDLKAACLPDPFASLAIMQDATLILDDRKYPSFSGSLYSVNKTFGEKNPDLVTKFLVSIDRAINDINKDKERWGEFAVEKKLVPSPLKGKYVLPDFPRASVPDEKMWKDVNSWLIQKNLIKKTLLFSESITDRFVKR